jgi:hypothetical protein
VSGGSEVGIQSSATSSRLKQADAKVRLPLLVPGECNLVQAGQVEASTRVTRRFAPLVTKSNLRVPDRTSALHLGVRISLLRLELLLSEKPRSAAEGRPSVGHGERDSRGRDTHLAGRIVETNYGGQCAAASRGLSRDDILRKVHIG